MNPDTNMFEELVEADPEQQKEIEDRIAQLLRPDGTKVPTHWSVFTVGEHYVINNYTFKCAYIGETSILFEPVAPVILGEDDG